MSVEISVFAGLLVTAAFLSVVVKSLLYAVFFQIQAVMAVAGILAGLNAPLRQSRTTAATADSRKMVPAQIRLMMYFPETYCRRVTGRVSQ